MKPWEKQYSPKPWERDRQGQDSIESDPFSVYESDPVATMTEREQEAVNAVTSEDDVELVLATQFYNTRDDTNYPPEAIEAQISYEYGDNASPTEANAKNRKVLEWEKRQKEKMDDYAKRTSPFFESPEIGRMVYDAALKRKEIPARLDITAPPEAHEFRNEKLAEYESYVAKLPLEARMEIESLELRQQYDADKRIWAGRDKTQMPPHVRRRMEDAEDVLGITDTDFEKRVKSGRAKRWFDLFEFSRYSTHEEQKIAMDINISSKEIAQRKIDNLHEIQDLADLTLPKAEGAGELFWFGTLGSVGPMAEGIAIGWATGGTMDKAYWALQGQGAVVSDYVRETKTKLTQMSDAEFIRLREISKATGAVYAAIEYIGRAGGAQNTKPAKEGVKKLVREAMINDGTLKKLKKGGVAFLKEWLLKEGGEEFLQAGAQEFGKDLVALDVEPLEIALESWRQYKDALPGVAGIVIGGKGVSMARNKRARNRAIDEYVEKTAPQLMFELGQTEEQAEQTARDLANAKDELEFRAIVSMATRDQIDAGIIRDPAVDAPRSKTQTVSVGGEIDQAKGKVMTLGDANRMRKQHTDSELDKLAEQEIITPEQAEAVKAPEADREQMLDAANDNLIQIEEEAEPTKETENIQPDPIDVGEEVSADGKSIFVDMTNAELAEYLVDLRESNIEPSAEMTEEMSNRFDDDPDAVKIFTDRIRQIVGQRKKDRKQSVERPLIEERPEKIEIISDKVAAIQGRSAQNFEEAFNFLSKVNGQRSESDLRKRAQENAAKFDTMTEEQAYNFLKTTAPIERRIRLEREFFDLVYAGDYNGVREKLEQEGFKLGGVFSRKMQSAVAYVNLAEKIHQQEKTKAGKENNRVEVKAPESLLDKLIDVSHDIYRVYEKNKNDPEFAGYLSEAKEKGIVVDDRHVARIVNKHFSELKDSTQLYLEVEAEAVDFEGEQAVGHYRGMPDGNLHGSHITTLGQSIDNLQQEEYEIDARPESLKRVEASAGVIENDLRGRSGVELLESLSKDEQDMALRYAASRTGYLEESEAPALEELPQAAQEFFAEGQGWDVLAPQINGLLTEAKADLGIDYEGLVGYYFPMRHIFETDAAARTTDDLLEASLGSTKHRSGTFNPSKMLSPAEQINTYLSEISNLLALARDIAEQRTILQDNALETAQALEKQEAGSELDSRDQWLLDKLEELRELESEGVKVGLQESAMSDGEVFEWIAELENDGGGSDPGSLFGKLQKGQLEPDQEQALESSGAVENKLVENGKDWINVVDPSFVVVRMDDVGEVSEDGKVYSANTKLYHQTIKRAANQKQLRQKSVDDMKEMLKSRYGKLTKDNLKAANELLSSVFFGPGRSMAMRAQYPAEIAHDFNLSKEDAKLVYDVSIRMRDALNIVAMAPDFESDVRGISKEKRRRFFELSRKAQEGTVTEAELDELARLNPQGKLAQFGRWMFERQAMDSKDFFGYLTSLEASAIRTMEFDLLYKKIRFWADYLESRGQTANAKWWRNRAEVSIKGDMFQWENKLLDVVATLANKKDRSELDKDIIKANMVEAMNILQRARVNAWLGGNIGWSLVTQLGSITMTGQQAGYRRTAASIFDVLTRRQSYSESETARLKSGRYGAKDIEAIGEFQSERLGETKRQKIRNWLGVFASAEENLLTGVSFVAGYNYATEKLGLNEEQARIHGDLVAASTQSMYDRTTRNIALSSHTLRAAKPMQSFVYTKFSNILQLLGKTGLKESGRTRLLKAAKWMAADVLFAYLISLFWGDDPEKALLDPEYKKVGIGSGVPLVGKQIDIFMSDVLPWQESRKWQDRSAPEVFATRTSRLLAMGVDNEYFMRELGLYSLQYVTPMMGVPGSVPTENLIKMMSAEMGDGEYRDISGRKSWEFKDKNSPLRWPMGMAFGYKAVDETEKQKDSKKSGKGKKQVGIYE